MPVVGVLTGGGDCPGLNAVIRAVTATAVRSGSTVVGIRNGWEGLMRGRTRPLDRDAVRGIIGRGGTILGTSRLDPYVHGNGLADLEPTLAETGIDSVVVIGGDGTLATGLRLAGEGLPVIGVPKTIDNDIAATDVTFGFDTAVQVATEAIDRLTTTAEAHNRVILVEVMGRTKGWIATHAGIAAGADAILIPEHQMTLRQVADTLTRRHEGGRTYSIVVVAEGINPPEEQDLPTDTYGFERLGGVAYEVAPVIEAMTGFETRVTVLGHLQRGGTPTAFDRVLATRMGVAAAELALAGESGVMTALRGTAIVPVPLADACATVRGVPESLFGVAQTFFE
jgi:6-phosphofructokinase 1